MKYMVTTISCKNNYIVKCYSLKGTSINVSWELRVVLVLSRDHLPIDQLLHQRSVVVILREQILDKRVIGFACWSNNACILI